VGRLKLSDPSHSKEKERAGSRAWKVYDTRYFLGGIITNIKCPPLWKFLQLLYVVLGPFDSHPGIGIPMMKNLKMIT